MACSKEEVTVAEATVAVGELVYHLQQHFKHHTGFDVTEIIKAGSLGHGTVVPGEFDIDLVLYSRGIIAKKIPSRGLEERLEIIKSFLSKTLLHKFQHQKNTPHAVQFKYDGKIDVDLLISPFWESQHDLYTFLRTLHPRERFDFSASAAKWQVDFFRHQDEQVKEFIRRAKAWRNKKWPKSKGGSGRPKSYFLSVLVLCAYENAVAALGHQASTRAMAERTTQNLKSIVINHRAADIFWTQYYTRQDYKDLLPSRPRVIDPANPSNNLYETGIIRSYQAHDRAHDYEEGDGDWTEFVRFIDTLDLTETTEEIQVESVLRLERMTVAGRGITMAEATAAMEELVLHLQQNYESHTKSPVTELVKAGSLGYGTVVSREFNLDLVLISRKTYLHMKESGVVYPYTVTPNEKDIFMVKQMLNFLSTTLSPHHKFQHKQTTDCAVQFIYDRKIDVDLLSSPYFESQHDLYKFLRKLRPCERLILLEKAAKWQVDFFQHQDEQVKEFIRRAKAWRNKKWPKNERCYGRPKSYFLSVLVLRAYENAVAALGRYASTRAMADRITQELKGFVKDHDSLDIYWECYYKIRDYEDLVPSCPRVIDPANPNNNLYETGITKTHHARERSHDYEEGGGDWSQFVGHIDTIDLTLPAPEI